MPFNLATVLIDMIYVGGDHPTVWVHPIIGQFFLRNDMPSSHNVYGVLKHMYQIKMIEDVENETVYHIDENTPNTWYDHIDYEAFYESPNRSY